MKNSSSETSNNVLKATQEVGRRNEMGCEPRSLGSREPELWPLCSAESRPRGREDGLRRSFGVPVFRALDLAWLLSRPGIC